MVFSRTLLWGIILFSVVLAGCSLTDKTGQTIRMGGIDLMGDRPSLDIQITGSALVDADGNVISSDVVIETTCGVLNQGATVAASNVENVCLWKTSESARAPFVKSVDLASSFSLPVVQKRQWTTTHELDGGDSPYMEEALLPILQHMYDYSASQQNDRTPSTRVFVEYNVDKTEQIAEAVETNNRRGYSFIIDRDNFDVTFNPITCRESGECDPGCGCLEGQCVNMVVTRSAGGLRQKAYTSNACGNDYS